MATSTDEILVRLGFDASTVQRGTMAMLETQKKASMDYVAMWEGALDKQALAESKANDLSLAKLKANMDAKAAVTEAFFEEQSAQYAIAAGSVPANMAGAAGLAGGAALGTATKGAAKEVEQMGHRAGGFSLVMRESTVMMREGMRGNWSKMVGSFTILAGAISSAIVPAFIGAAALLALPYYRKRQAEKAAAASEEELRSREQVAADRLRERINALKKSGRLTSDQSGNLLQDLKDPERLIEVWNKVKAVMGGASLDRIENSKELDRLDDEHARKVRAFNRENWDAQGKLTGDLIERHIIQEKMAQLDRDSIEWKKLRNELDDKNRDILKDQQDLEKEKTDEIKKQQKLAGEKAKATIVSSLEEKEFPTIEAMAGRGFVDRLNRNYGRGGQFDLERGNGKYGEIARDYLLAQKQQLWDLNYGNNGAAEQDRLRMITDRSKLIMAGVASPEQMLSHIGDNTQNLLQLFQSLQRSGALATTIVATDT